MTLFEKVGLVCAAIPSGRVASYGQIAALCGAPRCARQVGQALGHGAAACAHRVVNCRGVLSGAQAFLTGDLQRQLLEAEGVVLLPDGRVDLADFGWSPDDSTLRRLRAQMEGGTP